VGRHPGPQGADGQMGRRTERGLRFDGLQGGDGGLGAQARQGRPQ
jgi:hypothetical protein